MGLPGGGAGGDSARMAGLYVGDVYHADAGAWRVLMRG